ncbi:MAG: aldo/keto reductase [Firmicutes bacterium]|nr:aldo/keto reductase [Bacillota bacterium]
MIENIDDYDTIFVGYPIWHGDMPMIVYNFLESYDFSSKTIIPFCTHEGSSLAGTVQKIKNKLPDSTVLNGLTVRGNTAQNSPDDVESAVDNWLNEIGLPFKDDKSKIGEFDLENGKVLLNSGYEMPILGIGTYTLSDTQAENSVYWALKDGYRLIDTARIYGNETGVGRGIKKAIDEGIVKREDIFVTTKMWTSDYNNGENAIQASLDRLGLDYIDLMILHHSQPSNDVIAYKAMEKAVKEGKLHSIGLSNYYEPADFDRLVNAATLVPALLQNETHPYHQSTEMKEHISKYGTVMESWYPLGGRGHTQMLFNDETIKNIATEHGKTSAQVILRWHLQAGNIAIPGSSNEAHIKENSEIFDFELSETEMQKISSLDKDERFSTY